MKKNAIYLVMLVTTLSCYELNNGEKMLQTAVQKWNSKKTIPVDLCYVLCDFSSSLSAKNKQEILGKAMEIFESAALRCNLTVYDINASQFNDPLFEFKALMKNANKNSERKKLLQAAAIQSDTLSKRIQRHFTAVPSFNTCIISTLDVLARSLATLPAERTNDRISIIILSDMLEDCLHGNMRVDIEGGGIQKAKKELTKVPERTFTFDKFKNLTITLTACSDRTKITAVDLDEFWKLAFKKFGYNFNGPITERLPYWVTAN